MVTKFARINDSVVVETLEADDLPEFHPSLQWIECGDEVGVGWGYAAGAFSAPVIDLDEAIADKLREIDAARDAAIAGGFEFAGVMYDSDAKAIQRINGAVTLSLLDPEYSTPWITYDNGVVQLDAASLAGLGVAAGAHERAQIFKARGLKDLALAATSLEGLAGINW